MYDGLFQTGDEVLLSSLKKTFAARMAKVQSALYEDVAKAGWFRGRPDKVRGVWKGGRDCSSPSPAAGPPRAAQPAPALGTGRDRCQRWSGWRCSTSAAGCRPAPGRAVRCWRRPRGFREYIRTAEAEQLRFEEGQDIFSRYLPFAVVFGETDRWVRIFGPLAAGPSSVGSIELPGTPGRQVGTPRASVPRSAGSRRPRRARCRPDHDVVVRRLRVLRRRLLGGGGGGGGGGSW